MRTGNRENHPDWADLPLDLIPDLPAGYYLIHEILEDRPELAASLTCETDCSPSVTYELLGRSGNWTPNRAFRHARVIVQLGQEPRGLTLSAQVELTGKRKIPKVMQLEAAGGPDLDIDLRRLAERFGSMASLH